MLDLSSRIAGFGLGLAWSLSFWATAEGSTTMTNSRAEVDQMALLWETDSAAISSLATAQYPQFTGTWQYTFPNSSISGDGDIHLNMAVDAAGTGRFGNNGGTASPIVGEVINATGTQLSHLMTLSSAQATPRGIFRMYTEHGSERHFEIHPLTQLLTWNGTSFVLDTDYHANIANVGDGATHATSTYTSLLNGSITMTATVAPDNVNVTFVYPSPSVNYVQYDGVVFSSLATDSVSSYILFQPTLVPNAVVRCRLVANTAAANTAGSLVAGQPVTINALTRTDMSAVADQISALLAGETSTFARPVEFITLDVVSLGPTAVTLPPTSITTNQATLNGTANPNGLSTSTYFQYGLSTSYGSTTASQSVGSGTTSVAVSQLITGLAPNTIYHFRIVATDGTRTSYGTDRTFTTSLQAVPTITSESATNVFATTATLKALVNPNSYTTTFHFEYGKTIAYGTSTVFQSIGSGSGDVEVTANITELKKNQTYHFRAVATNSNGTTFGPDQTLTTTPRAPTAVTNAATNITQDSATLNGSVNPGALATTYHFEYGTSTGYGTSTPTLSAGSGSLDVPVTTDLLGVLQVNTTYHFRLVATNQRGTVFGSDQTFTTLPFAPTATTGAANPVGFGTATLNGSVTLSGASGSADFEYGTTTAYGSTTATQTIAAVPGSVAVSQPIGGLLASTTYHFRIVARNASGTALGGDQIFTTAASAPPEVVSIAATSVGLSTAVLNGIITANSSLTTQHFEFGTTTAYGFATPWENIGSDAAGTPFSAALVGLMPGTTYHFRLVAVNGSGTTNGADQSFTTLPAQALFTYTFSDVSTTSGTTSAGGIANNVTFSSFAALGVSSNSNASGRFSFTNQPLGATNGSDVFTGGIDPGKYYEMSITPAPGYTLNHSSITFTLQRSSTGVRQYSVRGTNDGFAQNLLATINPANANLTVVSSPVPNILQVTDASTTANTGSNVLCDPSYSTLIAPASYRFYGFNAEGTSGTFSLDDVTIHGLVTNGGVPLISDNAAAAITTSSALLSAAINPNGTASTVYLIYGTDTQYASATPSQTIPSSTLPTAVTQALTGLRSYTTYHYRIIAANSTGVAVSADQAFTTAAGDRDGDGMPDDWEVQYGLSPDDASDGAIDLDGDGFTNLQEYIAGTDPKEAASALSIVSTTMDLDGFEVAFTSVVGKRYRVESTDGLPTTTWAIVADNIPGNGSVVGVLDEGALGLPQRFYRVSIVP